MKSKWIVLAIVAGVLLLGRKTVFAVKSTSVLPSNRPEIERARRIVVEVWNRYGYSVTVTSGEEPNATHRTESLHYSGLAEDYRTRDVAPSKLADMVSDVRARLGSDYDVVLESDHLHIEFDPKG
jgi:hypothetical protein